MPAVQIALNYVDWIHFDVDKRSISNPNCLKPISPLDRSRLPLSKFYRIIKFHPILMILQAPEFVSKILTTSERGRPHQETLSRSSQVVPLGLGCVYVIPQNLLITSCQERPIRSLLMTSCQERRALVQALQNRCRVVFGRQSRSIAARLKPRTHKIVIIRIFQN